MLLRKMAPQKGCISLGLEHDLSPSRRQEHMDNSFFAKFTQLNGNNPILASKIGKLVKFRTLGAKNDIFAPMAPTLINVTVSLAFWDRFYSFSDFGANFIIFA